MKKIKKLTYEEIILFSRELALIINSDISFQEGLDLIKDETNEKSIKQLCSRIKGNINNGNSFKKCIELEKETLTPYFVNMIVIGEESGNIDIMLRRIADSYEKNIKITKKIKSAITYPMILAVLMLSVVVLLVVKVIPLFNDIIESLGGEVNNFSKAVINIGMGLGENVVTLFIIIVSVYILYKIAKMIPKFDSFFDTINLNLPFRKAIENSYNAIIISRNLSMLIKSGINISIAFDMIKPIINNVIIRKKIENISKSLKNNEDMDKAFKQLTMFPNIYKRIITIANKTGHLEEVLDEISNKMEEQLDYKLDKLTTVLEPALIIIISLIVGAILLSIIFPVIEIMNSIG